MPGSERQNEMFAASPVKQFKQKNNPFAVTSCGRRRNTGAPLKKQILVELLVKVKTLIKFLKIKELEVVPQVVV